MAKGNLALEILDEGVAAEVSTENTQCCFQMFMIIGF